MALDNVFELRDFQPVLQAARPRLGDVFRRNVADGTVFRR